MERAGSGHLGPYKPKHACTCDCSRDPAVGRLRCGTVPVPAAGGGRHLRRLCYLEHVASCHQFLTMSGVLEPVGEALGVDKWGAALLLSSTAAVSLLLAHWSVSKYRAGRRLGLDPLSSGALRLAAARGAVAQLQLLSVLPVSRWGRAAGMQASWATSRRRRRPDARITKLRAAPAAGRIAPPWRCKRLPELPIRRVVGI